MDAFVAQRAGKRERVGRMRERIVIQSFSGSQNSYGEDTGTWSTHATVWANADYKAGGSDEQMLSDKETAITRVDFTIRRLSTLTTQMRVSYDSDTYDILSILETEDRAYQIIETVKHE